MAEIKTEVNTYQTQYQCDVCRQSNIILDPSVTTIVPFSYICPHCSNKSTSMTRYPFITYQ